MRCCDFVFLERDSIIKRTICETNYYLWLIQITYIVKNWYLKIFASIILDWTYFFLESFYNMIWEIQCDLNNRKPFEKNNGTR